jgi:hypothetical protein
MLKNTLLVTFVVCCCGMVMAQEHPKAELFGGYSYQRSGQINFQGWNAAIMANVNHWLGIGADFSGTYDSVKAAGLSVDASLHSFVFGPRFSRRTDKATAFAHVLVGGNRASAGVDPLIRVARARFALMVGGGLDVNLGKHVAARVVQVDYHSAWGDGGRNEGVRVSVGLVVKID